MYCRSVEIFSDAKNNHHPVIMHLSSGFPTTGWLAVAISISPTILLYAMDGKKLYGCEGQVFHGVSIPAELVHLIGSLLLSIFRFTVNVTIPYHRYLCNVGRHRRSKGGGGRMQVGGVVPVQ